MGSRRLAGPAVTLLVIGILSGSVLGSPRTAAAHPLGNFSISHHAAITIVPDAVLLRYVIDMAEIPTFQEMQDTGLVADAQHASVRPYLARMAEVLKGGLFLALDERRLELRTETQDAEFVAGAGGLPTMRLAFRYRAPIPESRATSALQYRDENFPGRAGWKEVVAVAGEHVTLTESSVPERDRSRGLTDYATDLLDSPPQVLNARVTFASIPVTMSIPATASLPPQSVTSAGQRGAQRAGAAAFGPAVTSGAGREPASRSLPERTPVSGTTTGRPEETIASRAPRDGGSVASIAPLPDRSNTPRDGFTELMAGRELGVGTFAFALAAAVGLGAFHALEPGHGKTVVAAYLVGARGTAWHACVLGLIVTASHTAGVYLLGAVTLYASRYVVPERLYPWLAVLSGLLIAGVGLALFLRRYAEGMAPHHHHGHGHGHDHHHGALGGHHHHGAEGHGGHSHGHREGRDERPVSLRALIALGLSGGIVPCPAALVVLLGAVSMHRIGFGLLLIVAFSVGLAAVLIAIGLTMVWARRFMTRFHGEGRIITHWLPLTSAAVMAVLGVVIAVQALMNAGILQVRL